MANTTAADASKVDLKRVIRIPSLVVWRVTKWEATQDARWKLVAVCEYPNGDWLAALAVAREWFQKERDEVERQRVRIKVDPVNAG